jgi:arylformamidase
MRALMTSAILQLVLVAINPAASYADAGLLRTIDAPDEPRGYCIDIAGPPARVQLDGPLQAHTCKYGEPLDDQRWERTADGAIRAPRYDRCLAATALEPGAKLLVRPCSSAPEQRWTMTWARLSPASKPELCIAVAGDKGEPVGTDFWLSPVYHERAIGLERCTDARAVSQSFRWSRPDERGLSLAELSRSGMPAELAKQIAALGSTDGNIAETYKLYGSQPRVYEPSELKASKGVAYGPNERQRLDIYTATVRRSERPVPIVVVFHGGGLVGGTRENTATFAEYFASLGFVGVAAGYRLAPDVKWPEGARDVGAAVTWLRDHAREYKADPERIFVAGISTGSLHVATYIFRPELLPPGTARAAGAILMSGPYTFDFSAPTKGELAYFGEDKSRWPKMVVPGNVTRTDIPVLFTTAEYDDARYVQAQAALYSELVQKHGMRPRFRQSLGHNHVSQLLSVGTSDTSISREILDFIDRVTAP